MKAALYCITIGFLEEDNDCCDRWRSKSVIAMDAQDAIKKTRLRKDEYIAEVEIIGRVS